jgi:phosphoglycolate phosphatase-like HAD superfamily hydrolase
MLVLWDIDHTLLDAGPAGRDAYAAAFRAVAGRPLTAPWLFDGRTELAAATEVLQAHGIDPAGGTLDRFLDQLVTQFRAYADGIATEGRALPGAAAALAAVGALHGVHQSVLTGNLYPLAVLKLTAFGLADHLDLRLGAYGGDAYERTDLPAHAFARVERELGRPHRPEDTVIVGDTLRDVATARAAGARIVAVATGSVGADALAAAGADVVLADLTDTAATVHAITGPRTADQEVRTQASGTNCQQLE